MLGCFENSEVAMHPGAGGRFKQFWKRKSLRNGLGSVLILGMSLGRVLGEVHESGSAVLRSPSSNQRVQEVELIQVQPYDPSGGWKIRRFSSKTVSSIGTAIFGRDVDLRKSLRDLLSENKGIESYFSMEEQNSLVDRAVKDFEQSGGTTGDNEGAIRAIRQIGMKIVGTIAEKVLEKKGIKSSKSRGYWVKRIIEPFLACGSKAQSYLEADGCLESLLASFQQNIGLALTHEIFQQELTGAAKNPRALQLKLDQGYRKCVGLLPEGAGRVENCVLQAFRDGTSEVSREALNQKLRSLFSASVATQIQKKVWPGYQACLKRCKSSEEFQICIDQLVIDAGSNAAEEKVFSDSGVAISFPDPKERRGVARVAFETFKECGGKLKKGKSQSGALIDTSTCENRVENKISYIVAKRDFLVSAQTNLGEGTPNAIAAASIGHKKLESCGTFDQSKSSRHTCLRGAVFEVAIAISSLRIDQDMPPDVFSSKPGVKDTLIKEFTQCLDKELPLDVTNQKLRDEKLGKCTGALRRRGALIGAEHRLREILGAEYRESNLDPFSKCLGQYPSTEIMDGCKLELTRDSAKFAARTIIPKEIKSYVVQLGPIDSQVSQGIDRFQESVIQGIQSCLQKGLIREKAAKADSIVSSCFKSGIGKIIKRLAEIQFDLETSKLYLERNAEWLKIRGGFLDDLDRCALESDPPQASKERSVDEYLEIIKACTNGVADKVTSVIAEDQLKTASDSYFQDTATTNFSAERLRLERDVREPFKRCMETLTPGDSDGRRRCSEILQREAMWTIGPAVGRARVMDQLGTDLYTQSKKTIEEVESSLRSCLVKAKSGPNLSDELAQCLKSYVVKLSDEAGNLKARSKLKEILGTKEYAAASGRVDKAIGEFRACLRNLQNMGFGPVLMSAVDDCARNLHENSMGVVQESVMGWMGAPSSKSDPRYAARALVVEALPCLDGLIEKDASGGSSASVKDQAEGMLEPLVKMIKEYIDYDASRAHQELRAILESLKEDLKVTGPREARKKLLSLLVEKGALDQLIKSTVKAEVGGALISLPEEEKFSNEVTKRLLQNRVFDAVFSGPGGKYISYRIVSGLLEPVLLEGRSIDDPGIEKAKSQIRVDIGHLLAKSPEFGDVLIEASVQKGINDLNPITRYFAGVLYGDQALSWEKVRGSKPGKQAEDYIRELILKPKLTGTELSKDEYEKRIGIAKELVSRAIQG